MLPSSDIKITLNPSQDFLKCNFILHLTAGILLLQSSLPPLWMSLLSLSLLLSIFYFHKNRHSSFGYKQLSYHQKYWLLEYIDGRQLQMNHIHINFDGGFFLLLLLTSEKTKKRIIIFNDQITNKQQRFLKIHSRITRKHPL